MTSSCKSLLLGLCAWLAATLCYADSSPVSTHKSITGFTLYITLPPALCVVDPSKQNMRQCRDRFNIAVTNLRPISNKAQEANCDEDQSQEDASLSPMQERIVSQVMPDSQVRSVAWRKSGACSGLNQQDFFRTISQNMAKFRTPAVFNSATEQVVGYEDVITQLVELNPGLASNSLVLKCTSSNKFSRPVLTDVRLCYNKQGQYSPCVSKLVSNCPSQFSVIGSP